MGELTQLQRANQAPVSYTYNVWGAVDSLTFQGRDFRAFGDGGQDKLNFPGDVGADVDSKGRLVEIKRPGLALKEFTYTDSDQVDQILFDGELLRDHDYVNGDLSEIRAVHPSGVEDLYGYGYDEYGRLTTVTENGNIIAAWTYPSLDNISQDPERQWGDSERVLTTTDGNGVVYSYDYDRFGNISVIELSDGPSFYYRFDENSNPLEIRSSGMSVTYQNWQQGLPSTMSWGDGTEFSISRDSNNNLTRIADNAEVFVLDLSWRQNSGGNAACEEGGGPAAKRITQVTRTAGDFTEVIEPDYNEDEHLTGVRINRNSNGNQNIIEEGYGAVQNQLLAGLTRVLNGTVLVDNVFQYEAEADNRRIHQSTGQPGASQTSGTDQYSYDPRLGNLNQITYRDGKIRTFVWDGFRRLREIRDDGNLVAQYNYDTQFRRIRAATQHNPLPLAFAYQGSKVIAIGLYEGPGQVQWTHAIGQGPLGPAFIKDLTGAGMDYYIFSDHLGTPLAYKNANTGALYLTPHSPWGTVLANTPTHGSPYPNQNFELPPDPVFATVPLGLSGHLQDKDTGLTYMHHRFYSPKLGHFLNPDFRAPDIYDPSTFTEPYAFASGNPIMFWDPNGLQTKQAGPLFQIDSNRLLEHFDKESASSLTTRLALIEGIFRKYQAYGSLTYDEIITSRHLMAEINTIGNNSKPTKGEKDRGEVFFGVRLANMPRAFKNVISRKSQPPILNGVISPNPSNPINPLTDGFESLNPSGNAKMSEHVFNYKDIPTQYTSASDLRYGSQLHNGKVYLINADNVQYVNNKQLVVSLVDEFLEGNSDIKRVNIENWLKIQKPVENLSSLTKEANLPRWLLGANDIDGKVINGKLVKEYEGLILGKVNPGDIETPGLRRMKYAGRSLQFFGYIMSAYELNEARKRAVIRESNAPYLGWGLREGAAFAGGGLGTIGGAKLGAASGFVGGGPGGAILGGFLGGFGGALIGDTIADEIDPN